MKIVKTKADVRAALNQISERLVAYVPTMGALHEGHYTLIREARQAVGSEGAVVVSIFVNPTQFNNSDDLENYPNTLDQDLAGCRSEGADVVFTPDADTMYEADSSITVTEGMLSTTLCGASREGHFDGVCTVVLKLYNLVQPDVMLFGEKDFQQVAVIQRMVRDLDIPVRIIPVPTVRDSSGLALSSRNSRLTPTALMEAPVIYKTLKKLARLLSAGEVPLVGATSYLEVALAPLQTDTRIDYVEVVDAETMQPVENLHRESILTIAVFFNDIRLIDHVSV